MYYTIQFTKIPIWTIVSPPTSNYKVNEIFVAFSEKALTDVLIGNDLKNISLASLPFNSFLVLLQESYVTSAVSLSVIQFYMCLE